MSVEEILQNWEEKQKEKCPDYSRRTREGKSGERKTRSKKGGRGREHSPR